MTLQEYDKGLPAEASCRSILRGGMYFPDRKLFVYPAYCQLHEVYDFEDLKIHEEDKP